MPRESLDHGQVEAEARGLRLHLSSPLQRTRIVVDKNGQIVEVEAPERYAEQVERERMKALKEAAKPSPYI